VYRISKQYTAFVNNVPDASSSMSHIFKG